MICERILTALAAALTRVVGRLEQKEEELRRARMLARFPVDSRVRLVLPYEHEDAYHVWTVKRYWADADDFYLEREGKGRTHVFTYAHAHVMRRVL